MNTLDWKNLEGSWHIIIGKLKQKCGEFHHDDLKIEQGKEEELMGKLEKRTHMTRDDIQKFIMQVSGQAALKH